MKLLVLTTSLFGEPAGGGEICTARLLKNLRAGGHRITLVGRGDAAAAGRWCDEAHSVGPLEPPFSAQRPGRRLLAVAGALTSGTAITVYRQEVRRARQVLRALSAGPFDACIVDHLQAWPWLGGRPFLPTMLLNHNVESDNYQHLALAAGRGSRGKTLRQRIASALLLRESALLRRIEQQVLRDAAVLACLSDVDAQRLQQLKGDAGSFARAQLVVLPGYPFGADAPAPVAFPGETASNRPRRIGLIGNWSWAHNRAGLLWLLQWVWPLLEGRCQLVLAGGGLEGLPLPARTLVLGRVSDVSEFYRVADVVAIPSLHGSGVQEKAIEAIGKGATVVATMHALRGLGPGLPPHVHWADEPAAFARLCTVLPLQQADEAQASTWAQARSLVYADALRQALHQLAQRSSAPLAEGAHAASLP